MKYLIAILTGTLLLATVQGAASNPDQKLERYFADQTSALTRSNDLEQFSTLAEWERAKPKLRLELLEMLGLHPFPEKTDLRTVVTGRIHHTDFDVENIHFQSLPGLYVTGNLYLPKGRPRPSPAILYVCGHARRKEGEVSFGNKTAYHHHAVWFARNGYVCLTIDTIQLGELEGLHHGTYREGMWWWNSRGYTPAGVEAWNSLRAVDYLQSRQEVDPSRIGVTGRSGGGAYSWWLAAIDERIQVAAPVAGIADLHNHVVDGVVEGHCDCMYFVNTYQWDFAKVAALVAPRPLMLANSDSDNIFPLDGVIRVRNQVHHIYNLYDAAEDFALLITPGPHQDTQDLQVPVFRWFNKHLHGNESPIPQVAEQLFTPEELKVFNELPQDERTTTIHESFVPPAAKPTVPAGPAEWTPMVEQWLSALREKSFAAWPDQKPDPNLTAVLTNRLHSLEFKLFEFTSQTNVQLPLFVVHTRSGSKPRQVNVQILSQADWDAWLGLAGAGFQSALQDRYNVQAAADHDPARFKRWADLFERNYQAAVFFPPRGLGPDAWTGNERKQVQYKRRFMLLGQTLDGMRVWDIQRALEAIRLIPDWQDAELHVTASGDMGVNALFASLFSNEADRLQAAAIPNTLRNGPDYLNVLRILDLPAAIAIAASRTPLHIHTVQGEIWDYPRAVAQQLNFAPNQLILPKP